MKEVTFISSSCGMANWPRTLAMIATVQLHFPDSLVFIRPHGIPVTDDSLGYLQTVAGLRTLHGNSRFFHSELPSTKPLSIARMLPQITTRYVCLIDNDVIITGSNWMTHHLELLQSGFSAVGGMGESLVWCSERQPWKSGEPCEVLNGAIITTTTELLWEIPHDDLPGCFLDDVVWSMRLKLAGKLVTFYPADAVHHFDTNVYPNFDRKAMRQHSLDEFHRVFGEHLP